MSEAPHPPRMSKDEPPPFLGAWRNVYVFVVCYLAFLIFAFYIFSRAVTP